MRNNPRAKLYRYSYPTDRQVREVAGGGPHPDRLRVLRSREVPHRYLKDICAVRSYANGGWRYVVCVGLRSGKHYCLPIRARDNEFEARDLESWAQAAEQEGE